MKTLVQRFPALAVAAVLTCCRLNAGALTLTDLPNGDTDTLSIQLDPLDGALTGVAGESVGWGFTVTWSSSDGDWISFTGSSVGSETNPELLAMYTDFIGAQGGNDDFGLAPGTWTESFDGISQGVGSYQIVSDPTIALPGAEDIGQIAFDFQVYQGDPTTTQQIGDPSYTYYADESVSVVAPTPEPATFGLFLISAVLLGAARIARPSRRPPDPAHPRPSPQRAPVPTIPEPRYRSAHLPTP